MIPLPEWAPNVHPLVVHFPIALLFTAAFFDLVGLLTKGWRRSGDVASSLYVLGALSAVVTYLTGDAAADAISVSTAAQTVLTDHADWAARTVWFYGLYGLVRLAMFRFRPVRLWARGLVFLLGAGGLILVVETGTRGAKMVFKHGVGVQAVDQHGSTVGDSTDIAGGEFQFAEDGSWHWSVGRDAPDVLEENAEFVVGRIDDLHTDLRGDSVLTLQPDQGSALLVFGDAVTSIEMTTTLNLDRFDGILRLAHHVKGPGDYDFLELAGGTMRQGRLESGEEEVFGSSEFEASGWIRLRVVSDGTHFRGYVGDKMHVHGHSDAPEPGRVGLYLDGTGTVGLRHIGVDLLRQNDH